MKTGVKPKNLKDSNVRYAMEIIRRGDIVSVAGISQEIRLSKTTAKKIIDLLVESGFVTSVGKGESTDEGGKRPELYRFSPSAGYVISAHLTPDSIIATAVDLNADIQQREVYHLGAKRDFNFVLKKLVAMVSGLISGRTPEQGTLIGISIALPGLVDCGKGMSIYTPHFPHWGRDVLISAPFRTALEALVPNTKAVPLFIDCTNRFQAIAEREKGKARGIDNFMILDALAEGLGAGIVLGGKMKHGAHGLSGEVGHMNLDSLTGPDCICGAKGCFEALVSGKRLTARAKERMGQFPDSVLHQSREALTLEAICLGGSQGDPLCRLLLDEAAHWFIVGLGNIVMVNDPQVIILQGEYVKAGEYFLERIRQGLNNVGLPDVSKCVRIEFSTMNDDRGVIGGAAVAINEFFSQSLAF